MMQYTSCMGILLDIQIILFQDMPLKEQAAKASVNDVQDRSLVCGRDGDEDNKAQHRQTACITKATQKKNRKISTQYYNPYALNNSDYRTVQ